MAAGIRRTIAAYGGRRVPPSGDRRPFNSNTWTRAVSRKHSNARRVQRMSDTEVRAESGVADAELPAPDVSVVVTVYNEAGCGEELYRRTLTALEPGPRTFELIFI